jgi:hypothetical protein
MLACQFADGEGFEPPRLLHLLPFQSSAINQARRTIQSGVCGIRTHDTVSPCTALAGQRHQPLSQDSIWWTCGLWQNADHRDRS